MGNEEESFKTNQVLTLLIIFILSLFVSLDPLLLFNFICRK